MRIDIWSDVVCPWCWIGKHRFQRALEMMGDTAPQVEVRWRPFLLAPEADATPVPLREAYAAKFGGAERTEQLLAQTQSAARAEGLPMDFGKGQVRVTTLPAAITLPAPMRTPPRMTVRAPIQQPSPISMGSAVPSPARRSRVPMRWLPGTNSTLWPMSHCRPMTIGA